MIQSFDKRNALLPLHYGSRRISIEDEIIVDYTYGRFYINEGGTIQELSRDLLLEYANDSISEILNVDINTVDFSSLSSNIVSINSWIKFHSPIIDKVNTFEDISYFIGDLSQLNFTINDIISNKVVHVDGKTLSDNNLSSDEVDKINGIGINAKTYIHPKGYVCNINKGVNKVNGYPEVGTYGNITLTLRDIGLGNIDPEADFYEHPEDIQCNAKMIKTLNGKTGDVKLDKTSFGLSNIKNYKLSSPHDTTSTNKYATPAIIGNYLDTIKNKRLMVGTDSYISDKSHIIIKNTSSGQVNNIVYNDGATEYSYDSNVLIDDVIFIDSGDKMIIKSGDSVKLFKFDKNKYIEDNIFSNDNTFDISLVSSGIKSLIHSTDGVYGVIKYDGIYLWGTLSDTLPVTNVEKVLVDKSIVYTLLNTGIVNFIEYDNAMIDNDYRTAILTYNDIIDMYILKDYMLLIRGNREIICIGKDNKDNHNVPSLIRNIKDSIYRIFPYNDYVVAITISGKVLLLGNIPDNIKGLKITGVIEKATVYKNRAIFINDDDRIISNI